MEKLDGPKFIGIDDNFTVGDKWLAYSVAGWGMFWFAIWLIMLVWNLVWPWTDESWASYFHFTGITLPFFFAVVTGIWFTWGGLVDIRALFRRLGVQKINASDDGTVVGHLNLDEPPLEEKMRQPVD